jgi:hypothetical protein
MAEKRETTRRQADPSFVDEEFAGRHGTTVSEESLTEEKDPGHHPASPSDVARKLSEETAQEESFGGKAKRVLHELDREFGGEYERREDPEAIGPHGERPATRTGRAAQPERPARDREHDARRRDDDIARPAVSAEEERFEGLVNEPGNPKREPELD